MRLRLDLAPGKNITICRQPNSALRGDKVKTLWVLINAMIKACGVEGEIEVRMNANKGKKRV